MHFKYIEIYKRTWANMTAYGTCNTHLIYSFASKYSRSVILAQVLYVGGGGQNCPNSWWPDLTKYRGVPRFD